MKRVLAILMLYLFTNNCLFAATINLLPDEIKIKASIDNNLENEINLIKRLVDINTATANINGNAQAADILKKELEELSFKTWFDHSNSQLDSASNLFAEHKATKLHAPTIILLGHVDTVYPVNHQGKFERIGNMLKGPGITDMKSGDAAIIYILKSLKETGYLNDFNFIVVYATNEELTGSPSFLETRKELQRVAKEADYILEFEPAANSNEAAIGIRNYIFWKVITKGSQGHSSRIMSPELGAGAIFEAVRIANEFREKTNYQSGTSLNIGVIAGGTHVEYNVDSGQGIFAGKTNIIAPVAELVGDLRALSDDQALQQLAIYQKIIANHLIKTQATFSYSIENPAMPVTDGNRQLLKIYSLASEKLGYGIITGGDPAFQVATDVSFAAQLVKKGALSRLGPFGLGMHSGINETITVDDIKKGTEKMAITIFNLR